jgi:hypothetical protein
MVVQDRFTGALHEIPDAPGVGEPVGFFGRRRRRRSGGGGGGTPPAPPEPAPPPEQAMPGDEAPEEAAAGEVAYDGFGDPVGFLFPFPKPRLPLPGLRPPFFPGMRPPFPLSLRPRLVWNPLLRRFVRSRAPAAPGAPPPPGTPAFQRFMALRRRGRWPLGWIRQALPYTGLGPKRLYMRCAVWPGPRGLVPADAAQGRGGPFRRLRRRRFRRR